jgi:CRISPR-associated protein Csc2
VTEKEFIYVLGNILRSKRYGAITSRIGSTVNTVIGIVGSDTEVFSTLEWINMTALALNNEGIDHPQPLEIVISKAKKTATKLLNNLFGNYYPLSDNELENILKITKELYASEKSVYEYLKAATNEYPGNIGLVE